MFNNLFKPFNSFLFSTSPFFGDKKFLANHQRKFILACFTLSNKENPSVYASISGLPDYTDFSSLLDKKYQDLWKSVIFISKHENYIGNLYFNDLMLNKSSDINIYNLDLKDVLVSYANKNSHTPVIKEAFNNSIFIFDGYNWFEIVNFFKINNIEISGGIGTKRHILSPNQYRLLFSLPVLNISYSLLSFYYHHVNYLSSSFKPDNSYNENSSFNNFNNFNGNRSYSTISSSNLLLPNSRFNLNYRFRSLAFNPCKIRFMSDSAPKGARPPGAPGRELF